MKSSYIFENLAEREKEAAFLAERSQLRMEGFEDLLRRHGLADKGRLLEVGCGQGIRTRKIAEQFPQVEVVGIDRSLELLPGSAEASNLNFVSGDLFELPFPDASFDFIYSRLVFMHLQEPLKALQSLRRVLKPGGRILIEDADRDCMFFEPEPPSFWSFWQKVQQAQRNLGGDPNVGRKLAPYFKELGFDNVQVEVQPILGAGPEIEFLARTLMPSLNLYLPPEDHVAGAKAIAELQHLSQNPSATFYHFWFAVSAQA